MPELYQMLLVLAIHLILNGAVTSWLPGSFCKWCQSRILNCCDTWEISCECRNYSFASIKYVFQALYPYQQQKLYQTFQTTIKLSWKLLGLQIFLNQNAVQSSSRFFFPSHCLIFTDFLTELIEIIPYFLYPSRKIHRPTPSSTKFMNRTCFTLMYLTNTRIGWLESRGMERQKRQRLQDQVKSRSNFWLRTLKSR